MAIGSKLKSCPGAGLILNEFVEGYVCPHCDRKIGIKPAGRSTVLWMVCAHKPKARKWERNPFARRKHD